MFRTLISASLAVAVVLSLSPGRLASGQSGPRTELDRYSFSRALMGTEFRLVLYAADSAVALEATERAFARIAELERLLSDYDPTSELSRLSSAAGTGEWVEVSHDLWAVLTAARDWSVRSGGAFDVTVGPLTRLWRRAARRGTVPDDAALEDARRSVGYELLEFDGERRAVRLAAPGMRLDAGGIGKGYAADAALALLRGRGLARALVDAGGDLLLGEPPPGEEGWRIELPREPARVRAPCVLDLAGVAVATSGDTHRFVEANGRRHSHLLDPATGSAVTHRRVVTVLAPTATEADALASALSVSTLEEGRALLGERPGAAARLLDLREGEWRPSSIGASVVPACPSDPGPS